MEIDIYLDKTIEQNAALYYEKAKKAKRKKEGVIKAIAETERKLNKLLKEKEKAMQQLQEQQKKEQTNNS